MYEQSSCLFESTGIAAAVIAGRLGGNETTLTTYTILSNLAAAIMIPLVFPLVETQVTGSFLNQFLTIFAIWISYTYLSPVASFAPSSYILWQNIVNSWQLWQKEKKEQKNNVTSSKK